MPNISKTPRLGLSVALMGCALTAVSPALAAKSPKAAARHTHVAYATNSDAISTWHQTPALLQRLDPTYPMGVFSLRPPTGYTLVQKNITRDTDSVALYDWFGDVKSDASPNGNASANGSDDDNGAELDIQLTKLKPDVVTIYSLDDRLTQLLQDLTKDSPWLQASPYQHGLVNGTSFVRTYFKDGPGAPAGQPITHGFIYKATSNDGKYLITIIAHDVEPDSSASLPLLEASVLTFRQVPQ